MKKKIAVFGNGWSEEYLKLVLTGIQSRATDSNTDIYTFVNYSSGPEEHRDNLGEKSMFLLPDLSTFDGIILLTNSMNMPSEREYFNREIVRHHIPAISLEYELEGIPCLSTDTYSGVYELASHIIKEHDVRRVIYVSGPEDNKENQLRMQAVNDALAAVGGHLTNDQILPCEWSYYATLNIVSEWIKSNPLPDAFVCANDEMALGVCSVLNAIGATVPDDVIVTGCDCIGISQKIYPILSTVAREWDKLGYDALDYVLRQIDGEKITGTIVYNSIPVFGESCGCKVSKKRIQLRRRSIIDNIKQQKDNAISEWHLRHLDDILTNLSSFQDFRNFWAWNFIKPNSYEGENLLICLVDDFVTNKCYRYFTPQVESILHVENGNVKPPVHFNAKDLLPKLDLDTETSNIFLFTPLHMQDEIIGYVVFINKVDIAYNIHLYTWARHISQDLERVRQNIYLEELNKRLTEASMTDALTCLRNRAGYDALAVPYLQKCQREGKLGVMIFADINRMKLINDKYGHLQGDIAICTVAEAIRATMSPDWILVRFGGDEFIMVGECKNIEEAESLKEKLASTLELIKENRKLSFPLSASFGAVVMNPEEHYSLEEYLRKADEAMYVMKEKAHAEN